MSIESLPVAIPSCPSGKALHMFSIPLRTSGIRPYLDPTSPWNVTSRWLLAQKLTLADTGVETHWLVAACECLQKLLAIWDSHAMDRLRRFHRGLFVDWFKGWRMKPGGNNFGADNGRRHYVFGAMRIGRAYDELHGLAAITGLPVWRTHPLTDADVLLIDWTPCPVAP